MTSKKASKNKQTEWQKVFKYAHSIARKIREKNPRLTYAEAQKKAWRDERVLRRKQTYMKSKALRTTQSSSKPKSSRGRGRPVTRSKKTKNTKTQKSKK